jgi:hypothetical protein
MYFLEVKSPDPDYALNLESVFAFDASTRVLAPAPVHKLGDNHVDPVLRIRWVGGGG